VSDFCDADTCSVAKTLRLWKVNYDFARRFETPYLENMTLQGLMQLESRIPQSMLEAKVMRPNLAKSKSASDNRKLAAILGHLGMHSKSRVRPESLLKRYLQM
jgi:hypothetical protein